MQNNLEVFGNKLEKVEENKCEKVAENLLNLLASASQRGYVGEQVSQLEHALQAAHCAQSKGYDEEVVIAALFHDVGHLLTELDGKKLPVMIDGESDSGSGWGVVDHEIVSAQYLKSLGFSRKVCELIRSHVSAKRYLTGKFPEYYESLSLPSKKTLQFQGGPLNQEEIFEYEKDEFFKMKVAMREFDDFAKKIDFRCPGLDFYKNIIVDHLKAQSLLF